MTLFPKAQERAQAELDAVLGTISNEDLRLPSLDDRPKLPYISALVKEVWRWNPSVSLSKVFIFLPWSGCLIEVGMAHRATEDDIYRGWRIEKGSILYVNIW